MTIRQFLNLSASQLKERDIDSPRLSAEVITCHVLSLTRLDLLLRAEQELSPLEETRLETALSRRLSGEPAAMIIGGKEFYGRFFTVSAATLVPRPETELMIDAVLSRFGDSPATFADLGAGSGCIAITLACERQKWRGIMADISADTLKTAVVNASRHKTGGRLFALCADMTRQFMAPSCLDFIVSNPPYVTEEEYQSLSREVRNFEPKVALVSGHDGLEHIRTLAASAPTVLKGGGFIFVEHGYAQGRSVRDIFNAYKQWDHAETLVDFAGHERLCVVRKK